MHNRKPRGRALVIPSVLAALLCCGIAGAAPSLEAADYNGDGRLDREEFRNAMIQAFYLKAGVAEDSDELPSVVEGGTTVTLDDYVASLGSVFDRLDRNADGYIDADEWRAAGGPAQEKTP